MSLLIVPHLIYEQDKEAKEICYIDYQIDCNLRETCFG